MERRDAPNRKKQRPEGSRTLRSRHRTPSAPDPELFARDSASRWRLQLGAFTRLPADSDAAPDALRGLLGISTADTSDVSSVSGVSGVSGVESEAQRRAGAEPGGNPPDDLLSAAAVGGAITNMAFLDILDGTCFARAPCLCCYAARSAAHAREAGVSLRLFLQYYSAKSYIRSHAFARLVAVLSRDLLAEEVAEVRNFVSHLDCTPDEIRALNGFQDLCVTAPPCQPKVLWVYSTPTGRRLLRFLARELRQSQQSLARVVIASSLSAVLPRFRYRMYAISVLDGGPAREAPRPASGPPLNILDVALEWTRRQATAPRREEKKA
jgi:hypothetical protein